MTAAEVTAMNVGFLSVIVGMVLYTFLCIAVDFFKEKRSKR